MKKIYKDPEAELIELDALIATDLPVSETGGNPGGETDANWNDL